MKKKRIIIDTDLWISFLISKNPIPIEFLLLSKKFDLLFYYKLFEESITVSSREKFRNYFPIDDIINLTELIHEHSIFMETATYSDVCRDEKDNFLLNPAIDGNASYLISGDKYLSIPKKIENTKILTYPEFINEIGQD